MVLERWVLRPVPRASAALMGLAGVGVFGWVDHISGPDLSFSIFYLVPIGYAAWHGRGPAGIAVALASAAVWLGLEMRDPADPLPVAILLWNAGVRLGFFLIVTFLMIRLQELLELAERSARTDSLTGLANRRAFIERLEVESRRARRYRRPLSLAYLDLDDFKRFNDTLGHAGGDRALRAFGHALGGSVRFTDLAARMGGDEFAVLLPETDASAARRALEEVRARLGAAGGAWPGFSVGLKTWSRPPADIAEAVEAVDALMYRVKEAGKGDLVHEHERDAPA